MDNDFIELEDTRTKQTTQNKPSYTKRSRIERPLEKVGRPSEEIKVSKASEERREVPRQNSTHKKRKKKNKALTIIKRVGIVLATTLALILTFLYVVMFILVKGPSNAAKNLFVCAVNESSAMGFCANIYLSQKEIDEILDKNKLQELDKGQVSDKDLVVIPDKFDDETPDIEMIDIKGTKYRGKMLIVKDPSRVSVGTVEVFYEGPGTVVKDICDRYDAIAGINGGEFVDMGSYAYTAMPIGCVISQGKHLLGGLYTTYNITGITNDNKLVVGKMTVQEALDMGVRDAVHTVHTTGPVLIFNGEAMSVPDTSVYGGGTNPRTAIGQRSDGAILLLVIDGRQANSIGATFEDLIYVMQKYGAVNACAMDGGTSTQMVYNGEVVNSPYSPSGPRKCPTAWIVK